MESNRLAGAVVEKFLNDQISSGSYTEEKIESLQVALQCIQAVYELDSNPISVVPSLETLLNSNEAEADVSEDDIKEAERLKAAGNDHLSAGRCPLAVECYTKAITLDPRNPVYYSNRAAAYTKDGNFEAAIKDCKEATRLDPSYAKAYGRLGAAYAGLKDNKQATEAYKRALELDPSNAATKASLEALLPQTSPAAPSSNRSANASPFGGKMPGNMDLGSILNNPEMMAMAQNMMKSGALDKMMKDPKMMNMMASMMGGQMPPAPAEEEEE